jgi:hypothetical protein
LANTGIFRKTCNTHSIALFGVPAGTKFQCDGKVHCGYDGVQNVGYKLLIFEQGRSCGFFANFLGGATHIDINNLGAVGSIQARCFRHHFRIASGDLYRNRFSFAGVIHPQAAFSAAP